MNNIILILPKPMSDHSEKVFINGLSLLKILKHAKLGIPQEVIGILLGQKIDAFTIQILDVFSTPNTIKGVNDALFKDMYLSYLQRTGYEDLIKIEWYHSHPGKDIYLSPDDMDIQDKYEKDDPDGRAVAIVIDPILSFKSKIVIGAFRNKKKDVDDQKQIRIEDNRQKTSFIGHTCELRPKTMISGLNINFYQMPIEFKMNEQESTMLTVLHKPYWGKGFELPSFVKNDKNCLEKLKEMTKCAKAYRKEILNETNFASQEQAELAHFGVVDPKLSIIENSNKLVNSQVSLMCMLHIDNQSF